MIPTFMSRTLFLAHRLTQFSTASGFITLRNSFSGRKKQGYCLRQSSACHHADCGRVPVGRDGRGISTLRWRAVCSVHRTGGQEHSPGGARLYLDGGTTKFRALGIPSAMTVVSLSSGAGQYRSIQEAGLAKAVFHISRRLARHRPAAVARRDWGNADHSGGCLFAGTAGPENWDLGGLLAVAWEWWFARHRASNSDSNCIVGAWWFRCDVHVLSGTGLEFLERQSVNLRSARYGDGLCFARPRGVFAGCAAVRASQNYHPSLVGLTLTETVAGQRDGSPGSAPTKRSTMIAHERR